MTEKLDSNAAADTDLPDQTVEGAAVPEPAPKPVTPYVRKRPAHRTVEPIDDLAVDDPLEQATHESGYTNRGSAFSGRAYRRSRAQGQQLRRDLHYGQYLEIPKGRRDIFVSRERKARVKSIVALVAVLAVLAAVIYFLWGYMQTNWGPTG